jgi:hypothetical protein
MGMGGYSLIQNIIFISQCFFMWNTIAFSFLVREKIFHPNFATYMYFKLLTTTAWKPNTLGHNLIKLLIYMFHTISYIYSNAVTVYVNLWTQGPRPHRPLDGMVFIWAGFNLYITMKIHVIYNSISFTWSQENDVLTFVMITVHVKFWISRSQMS